MGKPIMTTELPADVVMGIAARLYDLRIEHDMSTRKLAFELGCSAQSISVWEHGKYIPSTYIIMKYSEIFCVSADWILFGKEHGE